MVQSCQVHTEGGGMGESNDIKSKELSDVHGAHLY